MKYTKWKMERQARAALDYITGKYTYDELCRIHRVSVRSVQRWVSEYAHSNDIISEHSPPVRSEIRKPLSEDVGRLQEELKNAKTHIQLLEELLRIGKEQYGIDLRKKTGAKQS